LVQYLKVYKRLILLDPLLCSFFTETKFKFDRWK
jgi:hypothetical protein